MNQSQSKWASRIALAILVGAILAIGVIGLATAQEPAAPRVQIIGRPGGEQLGAPIPIPNAPQLPYHFGQRVAAPNNLKFGQVAAVAMTPKGTLLVLSRNPQAMMVEYDPTGTKVIRSFNPSIAANPHGLRVDRHGNIWVIDSFMNLIWKLNPRGEVIRTFGTRGESAKWDDAKWNGMFNQPLDVAFDKDDNFYVVQSHAGTSPPADCAFCATYPLARGWPGRGAPVVNAGERPGVDPRILKFDKNGNYLASASMARPDGTLPVIHSSVVTPDGEVWVGDREARRIIVFDGALKERRREIDPGYRPCGFFVDAKGQLWMSTGRDGMVLKMGWDGKVQGWFGKRGVTPETDDIAEGHYMTVSPDQKRIFVADSVLGNVQKMERN